VVGLAGNDMARRYKTILVLTAVGVLAVVALRPLFPVMMSAYGESSGRDRVVASRALPDIALKLLQQGLQRFGAQIAGTREKQTGALKETRQAEINYQGTLSAAQSAAQVDDAYPSTEVADINMCQVAGDQVDTGAAKVSSDIWAKAIGASSLARSTAGAPEGVSTKVAIDTHLAQYCSDVDIERGRDCKTSGNGMQNADITVSTAMTPNIGMTLSDEEYQASLLAAKNIVNATPHENVAPALESKSLGQEYLITKRSEDATLSLADHAFAQIIARRRSNE
jgi:hypothetical protein